MEFHISRQVRDKYQFDQTLFALDGNVLFADLYAVRQFVRKVNQQRDLLHFPELTLKSGQVNALGLIDEIFHYVLFLYRQQVDKRAIENALNELNTSLSSDATDEVLSLFLKEFPPVAVYNKKMTIEDYLAGNTKGMPNRQLVLEELIIYCVTIHNPALDQTAEFFESPQLDQSRVFHRAYEELKGYFEKSPGFGPQSQSLIDLLLSPARVVPHSLTGQLEYIREHWASFLGEYLYRILTSLDLIKEEEKLTFGGPGPVPIPVYDQASLLAMSCAAGDRVAFSPDREWMPGLVLIAKNTYVWLDQLSKKYQQSITHLDQIPEAELEFLAKAGVTGLWLIGLWERSRASALIKQLCGNPEAIASAYSLSSYSIAVDLGGDAAYASLRDLAWRHGIRLASDMVPNHMGIDSDWVIHHPEWFLGLDRCPYPSYTFTGPDLSNDPGIIIQIEDHYFDKTDAAVVFRRIDRTNGQTRYIYHGNDGTSMPWNDTAQLDYLKAEVREQVYQTILSVAKRFPIIRFDAAMTLAKKQVKRLWFPEPGQGGAIPSRSEHALTHEQFESAMPEEFWRNVVDRIAVEAPDTLLLAEAFWMMEGYFVRTLGMHRVYNSAFMHMLRDENNSGYKQLLKNTLEFEPEILKRYVNFMNNPDEKTAIDQFGDSDKYFGVCTLMATFPGLPMLGHGQIEGFAEKYGMEYRRAYLDEKVNQNLVERHRREIFPLLQKRSLFSGVEDFWLFDFIAEDGKSNDNVYAFTNGQGNDHNLVLYNNSYTSTGGYIKTSSRKLAGTGKSRQTAHIELTAALGLSRNSKAFVIFRDFSSGLQFIRPLKQLFDEGFRIHLNGYEYHVFHEFRVVLPDANHDYARLYDFLGYRGVPDVQTALKELFLQPVLQPFREIVNPGYFDYLFKLNSPVSPDVIKEAENKFSSLLDGIEKSIGPLPTRKLAIDEFRRSFEAVMNLSKNCCLHDPSMTAKTQAALKFIDSGLSRANFYTLITWAFIGQIGHYQDTDLDGMRSQTRADEWQFYKGFAQTLKDLEISEEDSLRSVQLLKLITTQQDWYNNASRLSIPEIVSGWFSIPEIQSFLQFNRFEGILWYNRDAFATLIWSMMTIAVLRTRALPDSTENEALETLLGSHEVMKTLQKADKNSAYQVENLIAYINQKS
jgi:glycosidase